MSTDIVLPNGIGQAGERGTIYKKWLAVLREVELQSGGLRKSWSAQELTRFRTAFDAFLASYPWFYGYWVRYANSEFKLGNTEVALSIYRRGLAEIEHCAPLWGAYARFLLLVCHDKEVVARELERGAALVGQDFYSHELWSVSLEFAGDKLLILQQILNTTQHQFAKFFVQAQKYGKPDSFMGQFEEQQKRVAQAWKYERQIHRPFFHPKPVRQQERANWIHYLDSTNDQAYKMQLYHRIIEYGALDETLWLRFVRWLIAKGLDPRPVFEQARRQLPSDLFEVRLYYALWLEYKGLASEATALYEEMGPGGAVQYSQFSKRTGNDPVAVLEAALASQPRDNVGLIAELSRYQEDAFEKYPSDSPEYWRAFLKAKPQDAEKIYEQSPEGVLVADYLALLAKTDLAKYVELDRTVHRSAL